MSQDKILMHLRIPAIGLATDVLVPQNIKVEDAIALLIRAAEDLSNDFFRSSGQEVLCSTRHGITLMPGTGISMYRFRNGDEIVLI